MVGRLPLSPATPNAFTLRSKRSGRAPQTREPHGRSSSRRRRHHPDNVHFIVEKDWMGGAIYGRSNKLIVEVAGE